MNYTKKIAIGWIAFFFILLLELGIDYLLRTTSDNFYIGGIPEWLWFSIQIVAGLIGGTFIYLGTKNLNLFHHKILSYLINLALGLFVYLLFIYSYVLGLGIDSF